ncbi:hypothetical protein KDX31_09305 [Amphritea atlantica]|uniref:Uncharacterized protein n=1 Tax=Amphritea atlantica TaxID=355243 RepID=A0ABY5GZU2_9GAMM|nr:hypothetical protein KDX31_09305 [Amphritea atlantica]
MKLFISVFLLSIFLTAHAEPLECKQGPANKVFGGQNWYVYACNDNASIVIVSAPGNPAMPFYFSISPINGNYAINGEGTGNKAITEATYKQLKALTKEQVMSLYNEAKGA